MSNQPETFDCRQPVGLTVTFYGGATSGDFCRLRLFHSTEIEALSDNDEWNDFEKNILTNKYFWE